MCEHAHTARTNCGFGLISVTSVNRSSENFVSVRYRVMALLCMYVCMYVCMRVEEKVIRKLCFGQISRYSSPLYVCVCVCMCICLMYGLGRTGHQKSLFRSDTAL